MTIERRQGPPAVGGSTVGTRQAVLPDGRRIDLRPATCEDVPAIRALFERLSAADRHRRFFSGFHPDEAWVAHLVGRPADQGAVFVAEVSAGGAPEVVAEADYATQEDGDGELALTVDRAWRGGLGRYLLDALLELAASRGVPNLHAEVLVQNRAMLALLRSRGYAAVDTGDPAVIDWVVSTTGDVPSWPPVRTRPRVLVEVPGAHWRFGQEVRAAGAEVIGCSGPGRRFRGCPMLRGERCPLVEGADIVIHALGADDDASAALLDAHRRAGTRQLVVDITRSGGELSVPAGAAVLDRPSAEDVRDLVRTLLALPEDDARPPVTQDGG